MRLIGAGLPRTGTLSQKVALEMLGLAPCYHMVNVLADLDEAQSWQRALDREAGWEEVLQGFQATVDWPGAFFYRELVELHPEAKVLLSVRDAAGWERSMRDTIWGIFYGDMLMRDLSSARGRIDPKWAGYIEMMEGMWKQSGLISDGAATDSATMQEAMEHYNEEVRRSVPAERLLVWSVGEGWEPVCEFLELPVPDMPFPHLNDSKEFGERVIDGALLTLQAWRAKDVDPIPAS